MGTQLEASEVLRGSWALPSAGPKANTALNRNKSQHYLRNIQPGPKSQTGTCLRSSAVQTGA